MIAVDSVPLDATVVDIHTHIGPAVEPGADAGRSEALIRAMDSAGVDVACVFPSAARGSDYRAETELICRLAAESQGRIVAFVRAHPYWRDDAVREIHDAAANGARGLKLHPFMDGAFLANDPVTVFPLMEAAAEHDMVVLFHSGWGFNSAPGLVVDTAKHFPSVPVVVGHSGRYGFHREAAAVGADVPNVYFDVSGLSAPGAVEELAELAGADRVLYGSDHPYSPMGFEVEKVLRWTKLEHDALEKIGGANAMRILGLDSGPAAGAPRLDLTRNADLVGRS